jgi:threonine aldolase
LDKQLNISAVDLRSDTLTKPTTAMREAMLAAPVGDDVFGEDPTINSLEQRVAKLFGMQAALFCPSGTMTNQIAVKTHTKPLEEIICDQTAHIYQYEAGGYAFNSGVSISLLNGDRGRLNSELIKSAINNPADLHKAKTSLVCLENTANKGGGAIYAFSELEKISALCEAEGLKLHVDGARIFNAFEESKDKPAAWGGLVDSISICFSKGLGCPVGSVLVGSSDFISNAKRFRKVFGGGMRQAGILAAALDYALDNHVDRLKEDHIKAKQLGAWVSEYAWCTSLLPVDTNIVLFELDKKQATSTFLQKLEDAGIKAVTMGGQLIRFVTHLDISDQDMNKIQETLKKI